jgi:glycosyltransferase involved in cell wall biosynthesis
LKILQINASYKPAYIYGGPTMSVSKLSEQLVKAGCHVDVFTTTANGEHEVDVVTGQPVWVDGVPVTYFRRVTKDHTHFSPALLKAVWKNAKNYDVVHIHAWWNLVSVLSCFIAIKKGVPVLVSPRGTLSGYSFNNRKSPLKKTFHNFSGKWLLNKSWLHATSGAEQKALVNILQPKKIFTLPNFVKIAEGVNSPIIHSPVLKLLFLSRIDEKKGLDLLLQALPLITSSYHLTIAGDGDKLYINQLKNITLANSTANNVSWIGFQNENKFEVMAAHDLLILPSHNENFGNVVIESLSVGTAVLISKYVGLIDYVSENNLGWLCDTDVASIGKSINEITLNGQTKLKNIRNNAPGKIRADFEEDNLVQKYIAMYTDMIKTEII